MKFGLIGYPLGHSFSENYFTAKFQALCLDNFSYKLIPLKNIEDIPGVLKSDFFGLNVTIPYKTLMLDFLDDIDPVAREIGAVNTLVRTGKDSWKGYNTDASGFQQDLTSWLGENVVPERALVLGSGGASLAVAFALERLGISAAIVSRGKFGDFSYPDLSQEVINDHLLIINTTPAGMAPDINSYPAIPFEYLTPSHWVFDLIYNPSNTLFLHQSQQMGARTKNGLDLLYLQADHAWSIWKSYGKF